MDFGDEKLMADREFSDRRAALVLEFLIVIPVVLAATGRYSGYL
jgi:hypothetical protein